MMMNAMTLEPAQKSVGLFIYERCSVLLSASLPVTIRSAYLIHRTRFTLELFDSWTFSVS